MEKYSINDLEHPVLLRREEIPGHYFYNVAKIDDSLNFVLVSSIYGVEVRLIKDFSLIDTITRFVSFGAEWSKSDLKMTRSI